MNKVLSLRNCLPAVCSAIAAKKGVKIVWQGPPRTDGNIIYSNPLPLDADEDITRIVIGDIDHEVGHIRFTDFGVLKNISPLEHGILNGIEDVFIERRMGEEFLGCKQTLADSVAIAVEKGMVRTGVNGPSDALITYCDLWGRKYVLDQETDKPLGIARGELLNHLGQDGLDRLDALLGAELGRVSSSQESLVLAKKVIKFLKQEAQDQTQSKQNQDDSKESGDSEDQQDSEGASQSNSEDQRDAEDEEGNGQSSQSNGESQSDDEQSKGQEASSGESNEQQDSDEESDGEEGSGQGDDQEESTADSDSQGGNGQDSEGDNESEEDSESQQGSGQGQSDENSDEEGNGQDESDKNQDESQDQSDQAGAKDDQSNGQGREQQKQDLTGSAQEILDDTNVNADAVVDRKQGYKDLQSDESRNFIGTTFNQSVPQQEDAFEYHLQKQAINSSILKLKRKIAVLFQTQVCKRTVQSEQGRLDSRRIHKALTGDTVIYRETVKSSIPHPAVSLVLDTSGSMGNNNRLVYAKRMLIALAETCNAIGAPLEIVTFSSPGFTKKIKPFNMPLQKVKGVIGGVNGFGGTSTDGGLWLSAKSLATRREQRKIMFLITDGEAMNMQSARKVASIIENSGIELYGLGIELSAINQICTRSNVIQDGSDYSQIILDLLSQNIFAKSA